MRSGTFLRLPTERVVYGEPAAAAVQREAERLGARRVFLMASGSLSRGTDEVARMQAALGDRFAGLSTRIAPFAPHDDVMAATRQAREAGADLIVAFGGGSLIDAAKIVSLALRHGITGFEQLRPFQLVTHPDGMRVLPEYDGPTVRQISTLSAGETNSQAGSLDPATMAKRSFRHPLMVSRVIVYDPAPTVHTPLWVWLSTGVRALDHAVELLCANEANPMSDAAAVETLRLLGSALPRVKRDPADLDARLDCQFGAFLSLTGRQGDIPLGISHAIGHTLGALCGIPHGHTSCLMLPASMRWNRPACAAQHRRVAEALGHPKDDAADVVEALIGELGMPRRLSEVGIGRERFRAIAERTMFDPWLHANPRRITSPEAVMEILELAA
jgi:maleylacetate reductase